MQSLIPFDGIPRDAVSQELILLLQDLQGELRSLLETEYFD